MNNFKNSIKNIPFLYSLYLRCFNREYYLQKKAETNFLKGLIKNTILIFDIGANIGNKTDLFHQLGARVIAVEPDQLNFKLLLKRFHNKRSVTLLPYAVSDKNGFSTFFIEAPGSAFNTLSDKWKDVLGNKSLNRWEVDKQFGQKLEVKTVTLDQLINDYGKPGYIKIDVEGHELACIKGLSQKITNISFEANLPEFKTETLEIIRHLENTDPSVKFNYVTNDEKFELPVTQNSSEFYEFIKTTSLRYLEIYSFMNNDH